MRLTHALFASVSLHVLVVMVTQSSFVTTTSPVAHTQNAQESAGLIVTITRATLDHVSVAQLDRKSDPVAADNAPAPNPGTKAGASRARFIDEPDFSALERIPVFISGKIRLSLAISHIGTVSGVRLTSGDPIPTELLSGIEAMLAKARLQPATAENGQPVASELELTVGFEPELEALPSQ